jgi:hypothetical protein
VDLLGIADSPSSGQTFAAICVAGLVAGCAGSDVVSPYAAPGKYDFLDCPGITERIKITSARERQLNELMTRASEASGGFIVNAIAYQDDLNTARANLRELRKAAEAKHCAVEPSSTGQ